MKFEYLYASKYGNGVAVAAEFKSRMAARGVPVDVHHIREVKPTELPDADLYVFSSPRPRRPAGCRPRTSWRDGSASGRS